MALSSLATRRSSIITSFVFASFAVCCHQSWGQTETSSRGFDALRIENEIKLSLPLDLYDTVWQYLNARYDNRDLYLKQIDPSFNCKTAEEFFIDQYFDDKDFQLLAAQNGLRLRSRAVLTDPHSPKNDRELIQLKINGIEAGDLSRGEYKYPVESRASDEMGSGSLSFLRLVKTDFRKELIQRLKAYQIEAARLQPSVRMEQLRKRVYVFRGIQPFATLTLDRIEAQYEGESHYFAELELELNEIGYTESDSAARREMEGINELLKSDILGRFPAIEQDQTPKYNKGAAALGLNPQIRPPDEPSKPWLYFAIAAALVLLLALWMARKRMN